MPSARIVFADSAALSDLLSFAARARRLDATGFARVQGFSGGIACSTAPLYPMGLGDPTPTVLGVRTVPGAAGVGGAGGAGLDTTVSLDTLVSALEGADTVSREVFLPVEVSLVAWTAVAPPRGPWAPMGSIAHDDLRAVLNSGINEVSGGAPVGSAAARRVRGHVWGRPVDAFGGLPAGVALALDGLGFATPDRPVTAMRSGGWFRAAATYGDVVARMGQGWG